MAECLSGETMESGVFEKMPCLVVDMETGDSGTLGLYAVF